MKQSLLIIILAFFLFSCKKSFLELAPKGVVIAETIADYDKLISDPLYAGYTFVDVQVPMGDESVAIDPFYAAMPLRTARLFRWEDEVYLPNEDARELTVMMQRLYQYNKVAVEVMNAKDGTPQQKKALYAEARANWAWINLYLVNLYGKPYNPATAATDPGYPIVRNADVTQTIFTRATVQEVYDQMIKDLVEGIPEIPLTQFTRARVNRSAAQMLLGKIYLYMGKYAEALVQFNNVFANLPDANSATPVVLYDYNVTMATGGPWAYNPVTSQNSYLFGYPDNLGNTENILARQFTNNWSHFSSDILLNAQAFSLYGTNDQRIKLYSPKPYGGQSMLAVSGVYRKIAPQFANLGLHLQDLYLMRAECKARTNDLPGAVTDLETFRAKRMPAANATVPAGLTQPQLIRFIVEERLREFALGGYRWFDMRRLSVDPLFAGDVYTHQYIKADGSVGAIFTLKKERLTMRFSPKIMSENPGMINNP